MSSWGGYFKGLVKGYDHKPKKDKNPDQKEEKKQAISIPQEKNT